MAEISFLHLPEFDHDLFIDEICAIDSLSFVENGVVSSSDRKHQVNFVLDLVHQRVEESNLLCTREIVSNRLNDSNFGGIEEVELGLGFEEDCYCGGFVVSNCGDDFYIARTGESGFSGFGEGSSTVSGPKTGWIESDDEDEDEDGGVDSLLLFGMNVVDSDEDEDEDEDEDDFGVDDNVDDYLSVPLCWDSFRLDEEDEDEEEEENGEGNRDFEWEEVDDGGVDDRDISSFVAEDGSVSVLNISGLDDDDEGRVSNLEWEVLLNHLNVNYIDGSLEGGGGVYFGDHEDNFYTAEYEMMFGQFVDVDNANLGRPPASKSVVEKLAAVIITKEDVIDEKSLCAVCKDHVEVGDEGKKLPCSHLYHGDCIIPWLGIRNTCPVCRFELPTDDPDYERRRMRSSARVS